MKGISVKTIVLALLLIISGNISAQEKSTLVNPGQYLFPEFSRGKIGMKTGRELNVMLNYNIVTEKLVFMQKGQIYDMTDYADIDTVTLNARKFVPEGKVFMEVGSTGKYSLLLQHFGKIETPPKPAAYGGTSEVSNSTYINNISLGNDVYRLQNDPTLIIKREVVYWLKTSEKSGSFLNEKQLAKIVPELKEAIRQYVKKNHLKFDNAGDVIKLISFCNTL